MSPAMKIATGLAIGVSAVSILLSGGDGRFETIDDIPSAYFKSKTSIDGEVIKVSDGDTFRLRHTPKTLFGTASSEYTGSIKQHTIPVRLYAVDTPETAKFGAEGQPFADEATKFTEGKVLGKKVSVKLLAKDRYGRAIAAVSYRAPGLVPMTNGPEEDLSEELLRRGLAVVYRQGGAQYDGSIDKWNKIEAEAKKKKLGIWSVENVATMESPGDYKKRQKEEKEKKAAADRMQPSRRGIRRYADTSVE
jgi:endonuclease YncB( thermonuclease family)